jgi:hypothetical protein
MATTKKTTRSGDEEVVPNVHAEAYAERQRAPGLYENPTIATPGVLEDIEDEGGPQALVDPDVPEPGLDISVDNRDQVQPMLDGLYKDALEQQEETDPEAQAAKLREARESQREVAAAPAAKADDKK